MEVDPLTSMRCWAVEIELGGRTFEVPALPAVQWWPVLTSGDLGLVLDFIPSSSDGPDDLDDLILSGAISSDDLVQTLTDVIEETAGRSLHAAIVLASVANSQWASVNGTLARSGFRWDKQPLGAALDAVHSVITGRLEKDDLKNFLALLDNEALTTGKRGRRSRKRAVSEFETMAGPRPVAGAVATGGPSDSARPRTRPRPPRHPRDVQSAVPRQPREPHAGSDPPANSVSPEDAGGPASDTVPPPPPATR